MKTQSRIAMAVMLMLLCACKGGSATQQQAAAQLASDLADQLGRTAANQIAVYRTCGDLCTQNIVFETDLDAKTLAAFADNAKIQSKGSFQDSATTSRMENFLSGLVSASDKNRIVVNGTRLKSGDNMSAIRYSGEYWGWKQSDKRRIYMFFYETSKSSDRFEFNGKQIQRNLLHLDVFEAPSLD